MDVDKLKERRLNLYDDTLAEIRSLVSLISQHKVVVFDKVPEEAAAFLNKSTNLLKFC